MGSNQENYFEIIDTPTKAYWLGFIYADGGISGNALRFSLSIKDENRLKQFMIDLNINLDIKYYTRKLKYKNEIREYKCCDLYFNSPKIIQDLKKLGCGNSKTFRIRLPTLDSELLYDAFLLGFYDGDGFQRGHVICSGNKKFLEDIKLHYKIPYDVKFKLHTNKKWSCYTLCISWDIHSRIILAYDKSMPRKRNFKNRKEVNISQGLSIKRSIQKRIQEGTWANPFNNRQIKLITLQDIGLSMDNFKELCKLYGLAKIAKLYNSSEKIIQRLCKENNIHYSIEDRGKQQQKFEVTKEELQQLVNEMPLLRIGKKFGVSDNAIKKRCKKLGIDLPKRKIWKTSLEALEKGREKQRLIQLDKKST